MSGVQNSIMQNISQPRIIDIPLHIDDRGTVYCVFDNLDKSKIKRTYMVRNWRSGLIRAWHGHKKADTYIHVLKGAAKVAAMEMDGGKYYTFTISASKPQLIHIPAGWYNGTMTLQEDTRILVYSTLSFEEIKEDDFRKNLEDFEIRNIWQVENR